MPADDIVRCVVSRIDSMLRAIDDAATKAEKCGEYSRARKAAWIARQLEEMRERLVLGEQDDLA
jgi:hypothetical protein